ncbi:MULTISPECIES: AAA family ATPase [unclassified Nostoc]|uniref:trifunctional serine/threonine-protein kinase/ATP-binding protein/sensor histidine kinase n=1 Tax=unclassified Nostoc TaxID=2593658 RepID=UPI002AD21F34|nr:AAA family ATPase [Nostoc sp. DedQUE03]MDZ7971424.1 AAA family ATPase [Nostoc sp. DedQUE03]MDZ8046305.1 AAA family ATPase [Nostoc sp. DedQUE02]
MFSTRVSIPGYYIIKEIYNSSRTIVYQGYREIDSLPVVIKLLKNPYPTFNELVQFRNQYTIAKNLNSSLIIQTYSLEAYQNGYALVMEDFGGISLKDYFTRDHRRDIRFLQEFLEIAIALCNTLEILYSQRIIHKDIKASNILINPDSKQVKLIDFSIASLLPRETQTLISPNVLQGTLAYISPEQTGRMNRGIDYRTDFYSVGVTFYELLTGVLPFQSNDPMELVHCHIAKTAPLVHEINSLIPPIISAIISKLMAKNAEERYQTVLRLKYDLENCFAQLKTTNKIENFSIAQRDVCERFIIPDKLYGREAEVETLLQAFEKISMGATEIALVAGFSGIGKTAVVNEVHKPIVRQRGYFIKGKFDQFNRNIPFSAFVQAFRNFMEQLLTESDVQIQEWKNKIIQALGEDGQVIIEVIPELEKIIGKQPPTPELSGNAAQNRFNLLFQKFLQVFTTKAHPLVIFLDDLQWVDSASLKLIQLLMNEANQGYLLLIGAYRDNEVFPAHPLMLMLDEIRKTGVTVNSLTLKPLNQLQLNQFVADTLNCAENVALSLSQLIDRKAQGNPFFATQILKSLHQDQLIQFNFLEGCWQCDISQINQQTLADDVVDFMVFQLRRLPESTQQQLKLAACIGNEFDLKTLAIVSKQSELETADCLWKALQQGLILPQSEVYKFFVGSENQAATQEHSEMVVYKFLHDRVQQAAYSLIPEAQKQSTHLQIGRLLLQSTHPDQQESGIFAIVNQFNYGLELLEEPGEREHLSRLNLIAGCKAKNSTAYATAVEYLKVAMLLLPINAWQSSYDLALAVYESAAEAEYLNINFESSKSLVDIILKNAKSPLEKVRTYEIQIQSYTAQNKFIEAIATGREALQLLDLTLPEDGNTQMIFDEHTQLQKMFVHQSIAALADLPEITDTKKLVALRILSGLFAPVYIAKPMLLPLKIFTMIRICIQSGNSPQAAIAYSLYGLFLCSIGAIEDGYNFGKLAVQLLDKFQTKELKSRVYLTFSLFIKHWKDSIKSTLNLFLDGLQSGLETGNLEYVGYCANCYCQFLFWSGENLENAVLEADKYCDLMQQIKQEVSLVWGNIWRQTVINLQGETNNPCCLIGKHFHEVEMLPVLIETNNINGICYVYLAKTLLAYLFGEYESAWEYSQKFEQYEQGAAGLLIVPLRNFYQSLSLLALCSQVNEAQQQLYLQKVAQNQAKMREWADHAPVNYQHKYHLILAEQARVSGDRLQAADYYQIAIEEAIANDYVQEAAIANELAAKFYLEWAKDKAAEGYLQQAYYCYAHWGAKAKTDDLEKRYPKLLKPILQQQEFNFNPLETIASIARTSSTYPTNTTNISDALDLTCILKAAQTISSCIELDALVSSLTRIILENSGAKTSVLILPQEDVWQVRAITFIEQQSNSQTDVKTILYSQPLDACQNIPIKLINYVKNTQESVIIDNCQTNIPGVIGEYMLQHQPQSVLCMPIVNQGHLVGILYLENKLNQGVFTNNRLQVINLLSSQAAIALENAQLYQQAGQALQELQQAQLQIVQSEKMSALGNLVAGVAHEMNNPLGFIAASLQQAKPTFAEIIEHLKLYEKRFPTPGDEILTHAEEIDLEYSLEDLPKMIDSMMIACDRLKNISTSLRTFSRADRDYKVPFNIHEGIDSTILILKHRLKANDIRPAIEVVTDYGNLPQIECFPGQLNQVFMNILANAIDALDESNTEQSFEEIKANPNWIKVTTSLKERQVEVKIADNGKGMSESVKQKVFDHLFTTKGVGKGTGLGLAIAQSIIVEKHGGTLNVSSILGEGTEFVITLPILTKIPGYTNSI